MLRVDTICGRRRIVVQNVGLLRRNAGSTKARTPANPLPGFCHKLNSERLFFVILFVAGILVALLALLALLSLLALLTLATLLLLTSALAALISLLLLALVSLVATLLALLSLFTLALILLAVL